MTILEDVKTIRAVQHSNTGFDAELLIHMNSVRAELVQMGVEVFLDYVITDTTDWPVFPNDILEQLVKQYMGISVGQMFDPVPSDTIKTTFSIALERVGGRIIHEAGQLASA